MMKYGSPALHMKEACIGSHIIKCAQNGMFKCVFTLCANHFQVKHFHQWFDDTHACLTVCSFDVSFPGWGGLGMRLCD